MLGNNIFILRGEERLEKERGVAALWFVFPLKMKEEVENIQIFYFGKIEKKASFTLADAHVSCQGHPVLLLPLP